MKFVRLWMQRFRNWCLTHPPLIRFDRPSFWYSAQVGEMFPRGYGLVYQDAMRDRYIGAPLVLNVIFRAGVHVYWALLRGVFRSRWEQVLKDARWAGFQAGQAAEKGMCSSCVARGYYEGQGGKL